MALTGNNIEERIWNYLKGKGLNNYGAAGLMGNLYAESTLNPQKLQSTYGKSLGYTNEGYTSAVDSGRYTGFVRDSAGYGLAQWTYWSRKEALLAYTKAAGTSIGDLETQLCFLFKELSEGYTTVLAVLKTATSVRQASDIVLTKFECPADQSEKAKKKRAEYGQTYFDRYAATKTTGKDDGIMSIKITTAAQLATKAIDVAKKYKTLYVMGCFGSPMNSTNKTRYCDNHSYNKQAARTSMIKAATADTFGFDCVCLIKGLLWGWNGDKSHTYGGATYTANNVPDIDADAMIRVCSDVSTDFSKIEIGEVVWMAGHIGVYVGDGLVVECTPDWDNRVQITACNCSKSGYNRRNWTKHGKLPYVTYSGKGETVASKQQNTVSNSNTSTSTDTALAFNVGDEVQFTGSKHYANANAVSGPDCKPGKAKVTVISKGAKHPYHVIAVSGKGSNVYGWVDAADVKACSEAQGFTVGDKVKCKAGMTKYSNGATMASWVPSSVLYVRGVESGGKILLVSTEPVKAVYTGRVNASDVYKI